MLCASSPIPRAVSGWCGRLRSRSTRTGSSSIAISKWTICASTKRRPCGGRHDRAPSTRPSLASCSPPSRPRRARLRRWPPASLDRGCARRLGKPQVETEKRCCDRTKKRDRKVRDVRRSEPPGNVTVTIDNRRWKMPRHRLGIAPMTPAERQVRHRAKLRLRGRTTRTSPAPRIPPRSRRWAAAVAALINLQAEYRAWLDNLPPNLEGSRLAEKLQAIAELDLDELHTIDPPRGYGWRHSFLPPTIVSTLRFPSGSEPSPDAPRLEISCESARPA